jgi:plastocyanin
MRIAAASGVSLGLMVAVGAMSSVAAADRSVNVKDFIFTPERITITVGERVTWTSTEPVQADRLHLIHEIDH